MNILVTGSKGQLGSEIKALSPDFKGYNFFFTDRTTLNITSKKAVKNFVVSNEIVSIINCAAYTAVDKAESEPELADLINHIAVKNLAEVCKEQNVRVIHISTDYVFDGKCFKPYPTHYPTAPVNEYGETKLKGENALKEVNPPDSMIIRTSWVYSSFGNNFVKTMLKLGEEREELTVVADQVGVPTYARDLAHFILEKALYNESEQVSIYQYSNEGVCSWYDFAKEIMVLGKKQCKVKPIQSSKFPTPAKRPFYSLMDKSSTKVDFNIEIPYWRDSLKKCFKEISHSQKFAQLH